MSLRGMNLATVLVITVIWARATGIRGFIPDLREVVAYAPTGEAPPKCRPQPLADEDYLWSTIIGHRVIGALRHTYVLVGQVDGCNVYRLRRS
jgi:hypothetical protein